MSLAYVLLKCDDGTEKRVLDEVKAIDEVKEAQETFGPFEAVVKIESTSDYKVKQILNQKLRGIQGIRSSMTLVAPFEKTYDEPNQPWEAIRGLSWVFFED